MMSQLNGPSNTCVIMTSQSNDVKNAHGQPGDRSIVTMIHSSHISFRFDCGLTAGVISQQRMTTSLWDLIPPLDVQKSVCLLPDL